ncbi:hypothetical protein L6278_01175 [Candidatus Parcubacteria bacterium]|nr:hypothetical protein [Patescibacteria group bacterium]MBU4481994.1 hypothetical protein [Patescibacteria group bacterium]MCG2686731.1 hypothetical protein [Candidatus Parcubacteria bacterium]
MIKIKKLVVINFIGVSSDTQKEVVLNQNFFFTLKNLSLLNFLFNYRTKQIVLKKLNIIFNPDCWVSRRFTIKKIKFIF